MRRAQFVMLVAIAAGTACSDSNSPGGGSPAADQVFLQGSAFTPATRTIASGTVLTFVNHDGFTHTITSNVVPGGASTFNSTAAAGVSVPLTLTVAGTYQYYCTIHGAPGSGMHGTIVVN